MTTHRYCYGMPRRHFLRVGMRSAAGFGLAASLRLAEAAEVNGAKATAASFIKLAGGPSHLDSFDPKPEAPAEYRGEFSAIPTNVSGLQLCEHLPKLATNADKFALL